VLVGIIGAWVWAVGVSYRVKVKYLFKNSFVLLFGTFIQTVLMLAFALIPVWILLLGTVVNFFRILAYIIFLFIGFSFIILCWMAYTQWVFDLFITPAVKTEKQAERAKMSEKELKEEQEENEKAAAREMLAAGRSQLIGRPIKPIEGEQSIKELGVTFSRSDIKQVEADRKNMENGIDEYYEQHKNDTKYVEYNKLFAEREKALQSPSKKKKNKKISSDNLLR
jgi:Na+-transporting methylmalonyl-CoA/oxaloacetate decarboxylase gamma subunit